MIMELDEKTTVVVVWFPVRHTRKKIAESGCVHKHGVNVFIQDHGRIFGKTAYGINRFRSRRVTDRDRTSNIESELLFHICAHKHFVRCAGKSAFREGAGIDLCQKRRLPAADHDVLATDRVSQIQTIIQRSIADDRLDFRACGNQFRRLVADPAQRYMPVAVLLLCLDQLASDIHVRHAKDRSHEKDGQKDAEDGHAVLLPVCPGVERYEIKIIFHL